MSPPEPGYGESAPDETGRLRRAFGLLLLAAIVSAWATWKLVEHQRQKADLFSPPADSSREPGPSPIHPANGARPDAAPEPPATSHPPAIPASDRPAPQPATGDGDPAPRAGGGSVSTAESPSLSWPIRHQGAFSSAEALLEQWRASRRLAQANRELERLLQHAQEVPPAASPDLLLSSAAVHALACGHARARQDFAALSHHADQALQYLARREWYGLPEDPEGRLLASAVDLTVRLHALCGMRLSRPDQRELPEAARQILARAEAMEPPLPHVRPEAIVTARHALAEAHLRNREPGLAQTHLSQAALILQTDPAADRPTAFPEHAVLMGRLHLSQGEVEPAIAALRGAAARSTGSLETAPPSAEQALYGASVWRELAEALHQAGKPDDAVSALEQEILLLERAAGRSFRRAPLLRARTLAETRRAEIREEHGDPEKAVKAWLETARGWVEVFRESGSLADLDAWESAAARASISLGAPSSDRVWSEVTASLAPLRGSVSTSWRAALMEARWWWGEAIRADGSNHPSERERALGKLSETLSRQASSLGWNATAGQDAASLLFSIAQWRIAREEAREAYQTLLLARNYLEPTLPHPPESPSAATQLMEILLTLAELQGRRGFHQSAEPFLNRAEQLMGEFAPSSVAESLRFRLMVRQTLTQASVNADIPEAVDFAPLLASTRNPPPVERPELLEDYAECLALAFETRARIGISDDAITLLQSEQNALIAALSRSPDPEPELYRRLASSHFRAFLQQRRLDPMAAQRSLSASLSITGRLMAQGSTDAEVALLRSQALFESAQIDQENGRADAALEAYREVLRLLRNPWPSLRSNALTNDLMIESGLRLAHMHAEAADWSAAVEALRPVFELSRSLFDLPVPSVGLHRDPRSLAGKLRSWSLRAGDLESSRRFGAEERDILLRQVARQPGNLAWREHLFHLHRELAALAQQAGRPDEAAAYLDAARSDLAILRTAQPNNPLWSREAATLR